MGHTHPIQPDPLAASGARAEVHSVPVHGHREKRKRGHRGFLRAIPYGRVMQEINKSASLIATCWAATQVVLLLFRHLTAAR